MKTRRRLQIVFNLSVLTLASLFLSQVILSHQGIRSNMESNALTRKLLEQNRKLEEMEHVGTQLKTDLGDILRSGPSNVSDEFITTYYEKFQRAGHELVRFWDTDLNPGAFRERATTIKLIQDTMAKLSTEARKALKTRSAGDLQSSRQHWDRVYESFQLFTSYIDELKERLTLSQQSHLAAQRAKLQTISKIQTGGGILAIFILFFVIIYAMVVNQKNRRYRRELERTLADLEKSQKASRIAVERFELAVQGTSQGVWDWNITTNTIMFSHRFLQILEFPPGEDLRDRQIWMSFIHPEDFNLYCNAIQRHLKEHLPYEIEFRAKTKKGHYRWFEERGQAVWREDGVPTRMVGFLTDISRRKETETLLDKQHVRLLESLKTNSLAEMARGMAQEILNPLKIIRGRAKQIMERKSQREGQNLESRFAEKIVHETERIESIITGFRTLTVDESSSDPVSCHIESLLKDVLLFCRGRMKQDGVRVSVRCPDSALMIRARPRQLSQVLLNLIHYAHDSMTAVPNRWIELRVSQGERDVELSLAFAGPGISEEQRRKIMSSKVTRMLGTDNTFVPLILSKGMVESQGGKFKIDADGGQTRFVIYLPLSRSNRGDQSQTKVA